MAENEEDVKIAGSGSITGGRYQNVRVAGSGTIEGDVTAKTINTAGSARIEGDVRTEEIKTAGSCTITGNLRAEEAKTAGTCKIQGNLTSDLFRCSGSQKIGGDLRGKYLRVNGSLRVGGGVEGDKFVSRGSFNIQGLLTADEIDVQLGGNCRVEEMGGEKIQVRRKGTSWEWDGAGLKKGLDNIATKLDKFGERFGVEIDIDSEKLSQELGSLGKKIQLNIGGWGSGTLEVNLIEGDEIKLEWTKAQIVRGKEVFVGKGCEIERVEYYDTLEVDDEATIGEKVKL